VPNYNKIEADLATSPMIRALLILLTLVSAACSGSGPEPIRIVALGDSTTEAGWDGTAKLVYPQRLVGELEVRGIEANVINAGIGSTTSKQALARLDTDVRRFNPDFVIVQFGINDSWIDAYQGRTEPRLSLEEYAYYLTTIIDTLRGDGAQVILMTPNPIRSSEMYGEKLRDSSLGFDVEDPRGINRHLDIYAEQVRNLALEKDVSLVDVSEKFESYDQVEGQSIHELLIPGDGLHPNDAGHALIAHWLAEELLAELQK
jgi:lysophospholipase L1-like esterase